MKKILFATICGLFTVNSALALSPLVIPYHSPDYSIDILNHGVDHFMAGSLNQTSNLVIDSMHHHIVVVKEPQDDTYRISYDSVKRFVVCKKNQVCGVRAYPDVILFFSPLV